MNDEDRRKYSIALAAQKAQGGVYYNHRGDRHGRVVEELDDDYEEYENDPKQGPYQQGWNPRPDSPSEEFHSYRARSPRELSPLSRSPVMRPTTGEYYVDDGGLLAPQSAHMSRPYSSESRIDEPERDLAEEAIELENLAAQLHANSRRQPRM
jgi:hypothetical protein